MAEMAITNQQQAQLPSAHDGRLPSKEQQEYTNLINSLPTRWEIELEFVQSLSNIPYLSYLAQNNYLQDPCFVNYLKYLQYWKDPQYLRYLVYPNCLHILSLLQLEQFRRDIANPEIMNVLMNDMVKRWQENGDGGEVGEEQEKEKSAANSGNDVEGAIVNKQLNEVNEAGKNSKRNASEGTVETIQEEKEDTEQNGDADVKDGDGDIKIND